MSLADTIPPPPTIDRVNTMPADELYELLARCVAVPRWARALLDARPYADPDALLRLAAQLTEGLSDPEVHLALHDHPRIGERPAPRSATAAWSTAEQSGVDGRDAALADALRTANAEYEQRFGHIYLVCASGRGSAELLADLRARTANDPAAELAVVRRELGAIARIRLTRVLAP